MPTPRQDILMKVVKYHKKYPKRFVEWFNNIAAKDPKYGKIFKQIFRRVMTPDDFDGMGDSAFLNFRMELNKEMQRHPDLVEWMQKQYVVKGDASLVKEAFNSLNDPFHYRALERALWEQKTKEAQKVFNVPVGSGIYTGEQQIISFEIPGEKLSLEEMLDGKVNPLYWQFGGALYRSGDSAHFRCQIRKNHIQIPGALCVDSLGDSWFVFPVKVSNPSSDTCWQMLEDFLQASVLEHLRLLLPVEAGTKIVAEATKLLRKSRSANKDKDNDIFSYDSIVSQVWGERIKEAQDYFLVSFDRENDDPVGERKIFTFTIPQEDENVWPDEYQFACSMWRAGGDWENPVTYFRCQLVKGYMTVHNKSFAPPEPNPYKDPWFVAIPPASAGNVWLIQRKGKYKHAGKIVWSPLQIDDYKIPKSIEKAMEFDSQGMWQWLEDYLAKLIEKKLRLEELEREAYERRDGKGGYDEATEEAIKKLMAESAANEPFSFCLNCGWKGNFVIRGTSCPDCQEYNVLNTVKYPRLHAEWLEACINVAKSDVVPRPYQVRAEHDNAVLMVEVPTELQKQVRAIASNIPEKQLTPEGVEEDTHITLLYGVPDTKESIRDVKELIDRWIRMSNDTIVSYFDNPDASVAKLSVKSTDLRWAHAVLKSKVANKHGHFFNPHITIAYLKPGEKISEDIKVPKLAWIAKNIVLSHRDGAKEVIALQNPVKTVAKK